MDAKQFLITLSIMNFAENVKHYLIIQIFPESNENINLFAYFFYYLKMEE